MAQPPHGTEVFVGGVPRAATEAQLREFAEALGEVHSVVLLKDPQNAEQNRGCALSTKPPFLTTYMGLSEPNLRIYGALVLRALPEGAAGLLKLPASPLQHVASVRGKDVGHVYVHEF
jgi:hypothetical protein